MSSWKNSNDREEGKPTWLTEEQRRFCVRTHRGWEIPLDGAFGPTSSFATPTEVIVAMSMTGPGVSGTTRTADGIINQGSGGLTVADITGDGPYFCTPITGDSYSLTFAGAGATHYIPIIFAHPDTSRLFNASLTNFGQISTAANGFTGYTFSLTAGNFQSQPTTRANSQRAVSPTAPGAALTTNIGFIRVDKNVAGATGTNNILGGTAIRVGVIDADGLSAQTSFNITF